MKTHPELSSCLQARAPGAQHLGRRREPEQDRPYHPHTLQHKEAVFDPRRVYVQRYGARGAHRGGKAITLNTREDLGRFRWGSRETGVTWGLLIPGARQ